MKKLYTVLILFLLVFFCPVFLSSVIGQPPPPPPVEDIPIDGGLGFLLVAGMAYGAKRLHDKKNGKQK